MKIEVTQEDIDSGERRCEGGCPIAMAVSRAFGFCRVVVKTLNCCVWAENRTSLPLYFSLPMAARQFIQNFDNGEGVDPFTFDLEEEVAA